MTKVTCLGDSIRIQYAPVVREILGDAFEIFEPSENCRHAKHMLRVLFDWEKHMKGSRIVHWNNGLWDNCDLFGDGPFYTEEEYVQNVLRIADILQKRYEVVIFATTTPVHPQNLYSKNEIICRYNELVVPRLVERGIIINDLHSLVSTDIDRYIAPDLIHLSEEGITLCAKAVAESIRSAALCLSECHSDSESQETAEAAVGAPVIFSEQ